jgi:FdhE protein
MSNSTCEQTVPPGTKPSKDSAAARITEGLDLLVEEMHPLGNVVQAFRGLLVERAKFKAELKDSVAVPIEPPNPARFERGVPLSSIEDLLDFIDDTLWIAGAERLMPIMAASFPRIKEECEIIFSELLNGRIDPRVSLQASLTSIGSGSGARGSRLSISPQVLAFALGQIAKPLVEKISGNLSRLVEDLSWSKGYCPICGTMPELAFLQGEGGQRWLRCGSCSHEWRFSLLVCPFCESENHEDFEIFYVADRDYEMVDVCHKCKRYVPTIDLRKRPGPISREVATMALMPLDVIAQEKGFLPAADSAWNIVRDRDVFSTPVRILATR